MTTRVNFDHNVEDVIDDVGDVQDDIPKEFERQVGRQVENVQSDAKHYVLLDPHASGDLLRAIKYDQTRDGDLLTFRVYTDPDRAPYATITEFGSGRRDTKVWEGGTPAPRPESYPPEWPYSAPNMSPKQLAGPIERWMRTKGIEPDLDFYSSARAIAAKIVQSGTYQHPFMRPAWFQNEPMVEAAARTALKKVTR